MTTDTYLANIDSKPFMKKPELDTIQKTQLWVHNHPTTLKVTKVAIFAISIAMITTSFLAFSSLSVPAMIALGVSGSLLFAVTILAFKVLGTIASKHDMATHVFTPDQTEGAKLYYQGDVPILSIETTDPYKAGKAHGFLLGRNIDVLRKQFNFAEKLEIFGRHAKAEDVPNVLKKIKEKIPAKYLLELQGIVDGYNKYNNNRFRLLRSKEMSVDESIMLHLIADGMHFQPERQEYFEKRETREMPRAACTVCIDKDEKNGISFGRNMDWLSYGKAGAHSLVIKRKLDNGLKTADVTIPGMIGALTAMNSKGLSLSMNVCPGNTRSIRGMPALFLNRFCLENATNPDDVQDLLEQNPALGAYHLSVADKDTAKVFHLYQGSGDALFKIREFNNNDPLIVTNFKYNEDEQTIHTPDAFGGGLSFRREKRLRSFFKDARKNIDPNKLQMDKLVQKALATPEVNNLLTTHSVVMNPKNLSMRFACDNSYAASNNHRLLSKEDLF